MKDYSYEETLESLLLFVRGMKKVPIAEYFMIC